MINTPVSSPVLLIGGGGHCLAVIDVLETAGIPIAGIVHGPQCALVPVLGYPALGRDADLPALRTTYSRALVTIGHIKTAAPRQRVYAHLKDLDFTLPTVISPAAVVSAHASIGEGSVVMHGAIVNAGSHIGANCIVNSRAVIEHECCVGDHCHIAVGAILCGAVTVGNGSFLGAGSLCMQGISIGPACVIGMGSLVRASVAQASTVYPTSKCEDSYAVL